MIQLKSVLALIVITLSVGVNAQTTHIVINTNDSGTGSLRDMVINQALDDDIIRFDPSLITGGNATITLLSEIAFSKRLIFKGLYNSTDTLKISGGNTNRIFNITNTGNTTIDSLVLINSNATGYGGAVLRESCTDTLKVLNSVIANNTASLDGGAINCNSSANDVVIIVENSTIRNNAANYGGGILCYSAAYESYILIDNSTFTGNEAISQSGGGLYCGASEATIEVNNSTISDNSASYDGGGIYASPAVLTLTVNNSTISGNLSQSTGGGICSGANTTSININYSTFYDNNALSGGAIGAIIFSVSPSSVITVNNSTFSGNSANEGGVIFSLIEGNWTSTVVSSIVIVNNSTMSGNTVGGEAVSVYNEVDGPLGTEFSSIEVTSSIFSHAPASVVSNFSNYPVWGITSNGYNVFNDFPDGYDPVLDQIFITAAQANLQPLAFNGGYTKTMKPGPGSVAINAGNPLVFVPAQNGTIDGVRDAGAAEACISIASINITSCGSYTVPSGDETHSVAGVYMDTIANLLGCDSVLTINLTITPAQTYGTTTSGVTITADQAGAIYQWLECPAMTEINGATNQSYTATANGDYAVVVTAMIGCSDTSACESITNVGLEDLFEKQSITVSPNPSNDYFLIESELLNTTHSIQVISAEGKLVYKSSVENTSIVELNAINWVTGVYFLTLETDKGNTTIKLIKE